MITRGEALPGQCDSGSVCFPRFNGASNAYVLPRVLAASRLCFDYF
jgi:hypothetical protein